MKRCQEEVQSPFCAVGVLPARNHTCLFSMFMTLTFPTACLIASYTIHLVGHCWEGATIPLKH